MAVSRAMERTSNSCTFASLLVLVVLLLPVRSWCEEDTYKSLTEAKTECCVGGYVELKRFDDLDNDSFVSLMGRRSAAQPINHRNTPMSRNRHFDHILADLLLRRTTGKARPCSQECSQKSRG